MARRRAQKAAQGKAANTASARRAKRRASDSDGGGSDEELQHKLSTVTDEKEAKRLKRLLRNRVSAQQARERKKSYVATLEEKARLQEQRLAEAEQRIKTLERENIMLRSVMKNMQGDQTAAEEPGTVPMDRTEAAVPIISSYPRSSAF
jgi:transcription factor HY5